MGQQHALMPIFGPKPPIAREEFEWLLACFAWLRKVLDDASIRPELVLPNHPDLLSARTGPDLFESVRSIMGMEEWDCRLECVEDDFDPQDRLVVMRGQTACGTFSIEKGQAVIRYTSSMLRDPDGLAATFAHELCHYLLVELGDPPGGPDLIEHATDCAAVYCGFGVLLANNARSFAQWQSDGWHGWQSSTKGYLSEQALVTATALFASLHGHSAEGARAALKPYLRKDFAKAEKVVAQELPDLSRTLAEIDLLDWTYN